VLIKKYFPIILFICGFTGFLSGQIIFDLFDLSAGLSSKEKALNAHYENIFSRLEFKTIENEKVELSKVKAPIIILNFWASWCQPCLEEFPTIVEMKRKFPNEKVMVFAINADEEEQVKNIKKIVKKYKLNFPIIPDSNGVILEKFLVSSLPVSIIYKNGKVFEISKGKKDFNSGKLIEAFQKIIKQSEKKTNI